MAPSTVSKALNGHNSISQITKERVKSLAVEWNYIPNEAARFFKHNKSQTIAVVIPDLLDQFYVLVIKGIEKIASKNNYNVIISESNDDPGKEIEIIDNLISKRVDGVIISVARNSKSVEKLKRLEQLGTCVTLICRSLPNNIFNIVASDSEDGSLKAITFLKKRGHRRIAHLMGPKGFQASKQRLHAYKKALLANNIAYDETIVKETNLSAKDTGEAITALLKTKDVPTAILVFKSYLSLDVINFLKKKYPDKLKKLEIIGFGKLPLFEFLDNKPLASIDEKPGLIGEKAAEISFKNINEDTETKTVEQIRLKCTLAKN